MTERVLSHDELAAEILDRNWYRLQGKRADAKAHLKAEIAAALQDAFDLGFRAAGGTVTRELADTRKLLRRTLHYDLNAELREEIKRIAGTEGE